MAKGIKARLDKMWSEIIRKEAGYISEYSGKPLDRENKVYLCAHHLIGKPNLRMRYELLNGVCITTGEHSFIAHHTGREAQFKQRIKEIKGDDIFDRLEEMYILSKGQKTDIKLIEIYLKQRLEGRHK